MARYEVLERSFVDGSIREAGEVVEYGGLPGSKLKAIDVAEVPVPRDWRIRKPSARLAVAKTLGFDTSDPTAAEVTKFIEAKLAERRGAPEPAKETVE